MFIYLKSIRQLVNEGTIFSKRNGDYYDPVVNNVIVNEMFGLFEGNPVKVYRKTDNDRFVTCKGEWSLYDRWVDNRNDDILNLFKEPII